MAPPSSMASITLSELLRRAYTDTAGEHQPKFLPRRFRELWFGASGTTPFFFLFKKNLKVTNIQFAELVALARVYTATTDLLAPSPDLHFVSTQEFDRTISELLASLDPTDGEPPGTFALSETEDLLTARCQRFERLYGLILARTVVLDAFHGSCVAYLPPSLTLDLQATCAHSGYIHSCGPCVWVQRVRGADSRELLARLNQRLRRQSGP